jgi:TDG/mug DNA glycosylase family protein
LKRLRDVVAPNLKLLFVGINPSLHSARAGHHFAGPGNPFWRLLHAAQLVPEPIGFADDVRLSEWGLGITNLCPRATRAASELSRPELARGAVMLRRKINRLRPRAVALVGITLHAQVFGVRAGPGVSHETLGGAPIFVIPNPSGLNASYPGFRDKLIWFKDLRRWLDALI